MDSFYVTLTSEPSNEFPHNTTTHFQKRIANTISLKDGPWLAGMTNLFLPDASHLEQSLDGIPDDTPLMHFEWNEVNFKPGQVVGDDFHRTFDFTKSLMGRARTTSEMLHAIISAYDHSKLQQKKDNNSKFTWSNSQYPLLTRLSFKFDWLKNGNLFLDNEYTNLGTNSPHIYISKIFAIKMGWLTEMIDGDQHVYDLGPNLELTRLKNADGNERYAWDLHSEWIGKGWGSRRRDSYWGIAHNNKMYLSIAASWTFLIHTDPSQHGCQYVQIRSNLTQSSIFNDTLLNVLAEAIYKSEHSGTFQVEPNIVRYVPIRQPLVESIEIALYNLFGERLQLRGERSSITLHFKRA